MSYNLHYYLPYLDETVNETVVSESKMLSSLAAAIEELCCDILVQKGETVVPILLTISLGEGEEPLTVKVAKK